MKNIFRMWRDKENERTEKVFEERYRPQQKTRIPILTRKINNHQVSKVKIYLFLKICFRKVGIWNVQLWFSKWLTNLSLFHNFKIVIIIFFFRNTMKHISIWWLFSNIFATLENLTKNSSNFVDFYKVDK